MWSSWLGWLTAQALASHNAVFNGNLNEFGAAGGGPAVGRSAVRRRGHSMVSHGAGIRFEILLWHRQENNFEENSVWMNNKF